MVYKNVKQLKWRKISLNLLKCFEMTVFEYPRRTPKTPLEKGLRVMM